MKLIYRVTSRLSLALLLLMAAWAGLFYFILVDEINDETDDSLEAYSEYIIQRALSGEKLPEGDNGTNNSYSIRELTEPNAAQLPRVEYLDQEVYIASKRETEPARVLRTVFRDASDRAFELTVMIPSFEKGDLRETILGWIVLLYVVLLLAVIALNAWIIHRSFRPLYALLGWLDGLTLGGDVPPLDNDTSVTEFRRLNEAMLRSAQRNNEMYEQQRAFIGNASHEMQTPIAVCLNRLEALANDPSLGEQQLGELLATSHSLEQLSKLNRTLLLLTKIENGQIPERSQVDVNRLARSLAEDYREVYAAHGIAVEITEEAQLTVSMNDSLASALLSNLLKNAFVHSPEGGRIDIRISAREIVLSNTAEDGPLDETRIFQRFWQGHKKAGAMGLGLSLADSICRLYGMRLAYDFRDGRHRFTVQGPR